MTCDIHRTAHVQECEYERVWGMGPNYDSDIILRKNLTGESMGEIVAKTNIEACCPYRQNLFPLQKGTGTGIAHLAKS